MTRRSWKRSTVNILAVGICLGSQFRSSKNRMLRESQPGGVHQDMNKVTFRLGPFAASGFGPEQCNREGVELYPSGTALWQQNAPNFLVAGAPKSGTSTITHLLKEHPTVFGPIVKELNHFRHLPIEANNTLSVRRARTYLHERVGYPIDSLRKHPHVLSFDGTPSYLYWSSTILPQVICVCPWIKIIVVLRDPVERFYSNFRYEIARKALPHSTSLAHSVEQEFQLIHMAGLNSTAQKPGSKEERLAWHRYQSSSDNGWLGKGLYDIQLRHLLQAMDDFGKKRSDLLVLTTENLKHDIAGTYAHILKFLGLHHTKIPFTHPHNEGVPNKTPMHPDIRKRLEAFYGPYNGRLNALLKDPHAVFDTYDNSKEFDTYNKHSQEKGQEFDAHDSSQEEGQEFDTYDTHSQEKGQEFDTHDSSQEKRQEFDTQDDSQEKGQEFDTHDSSQEKGQEFDTYDTHSQEKGQEFDTHDSSQDKGQEFDTQDESQEKGQEFDTHDSSQEKGNFIADVDDVEEVEKVDDDDDIEAKRSQPLW